MSAGVKEGAREAARRLLRELAASALVPASTYRLQLSARFGFAQAAELADYLGELGIHAVYFSPYFKTASGRGGYDIADPDALEPALGSVQDYERLCARLAEAGLAHVADVVPNHMGIAGDANPYWSDVLERGRASRYASFFDIDWSPIKSELKGKLLLPVLEDFYGRVLEAGKISLSFVDGRFRVAYGGLRLPTAPTSWSLILERGLEELEGKAPQPEIEPLREAALQAALGDGEGAARRLRALARRSPAVREYVASRLALFNGRPELLDALLERQHYRLAHWRAASDEINYRRFFNINELAALRVEDPEVFERCHRLLFRLLDEGRIQGLRIDHPDGMYDPPGYFGRLQEGWLRRRLARSGLPAEAVETALEEEEFRACRPLFVVVEKVLDRKESLPRDWRVHGTTGYEALNALNGLYVDRGREAELSAVYESFIGYKKDLAALIYAAKKQFLQNYMAGEIESLGHRLNAISESSPYYRDFTRRSLTAALREVIGCFPVYRTYVSPRDRSVSERDERYVRIAVAKARKTAPHIDPAVFDFVQDALLLKVETGAPEPLRRACRDFVLRFQQLTAPVMAKGLEDTAFYIDHRLVSLNEVGGDPAHFGAAPADFHRLNQERARVWPAGLLASSTHDTKRSEDARMRIDALSEIPAEWKAEALRWAVHNEKHKTLLGEVLEPDRDVEYFIYQTLVGAWPDEDEDDAAHEDFVRRIRAYAQKSLREAKTRTDWLRPDREYEQAVDRFLACALRRDEENAFLKAFRPFQRRVADLGMRAGLSALALRLGSPGVLDVYQGCELWNYSLVDPDNRRPVDFAARRAALRSLDELKASGRPALELARELFERRRDGRVKMHMLREGLLLRRREPSLFVGADYAPLKAAGPAEEHVVAFLRQHGERRLIAAGARFFSRLPGWEGTRLLLPAELRGRVFADAFTGRRLLVEDGPDGAGLRARELFEPLGGALLLEDA